MMKYKGFYLHMFSTLIRKHLREAYGKETTRRALKNAPGIYREMLTQVDDIGADNPMAGNIYMCFVLMAIWKGAEGAITPDGFRPVIRNMVKTPLVTKILGKRDMNKPEDLAQSWKGLYEKKEWADNRPQYRDKTWDYNIDKTKHRDGVYYYFTNCPLNNYARKYGYMEILPVCCELDYLITEANHAVLHRDQTLASGGTMCDYWVVPDKIKDPR